MYETRIDFQHDADACVVRIKSDFDFANAETLRRYIEEASPIAGITIVCLEECTFLDSVGLRALHGLAQSRGERFRIVAPRITHSRKLLDITGMSRSLRVFDSLERARSNRQGKPVII